MLKTSWIMVLPDGLTTDEFEDWYLFRHTDYAKRSDGLLRYTINRAYEVQPQVCSNNVFRIAELWWESEREIVDSFQSYSGSASRGDTLLNVTLDPRAHPSMTITSGTSLPVQRPAVFDIAAAGYAESEDGCITRLLAFGLLKKPHAGLTDWYRQISTPMSDDPRIRSHWIGESIGKRLDVGLRSKLPAEEQTFWDWTLDLAFDTRGEAETFVEQEAFQDVWHELSNLSSTTLLSLVKGQELFMSCAPLRHTED